MCFVICAAYCIRSHDRWIPQTSEPPTLTHGVGPAPRDGRKTTRWRRLTSKAARSSACTRSDTRYAGATKKASRLGDTHRPAGVSVSSTRAPTPARMLARPHAELCMVASRCWSLSAHPPVAPVGACSPHPFCSHAQDQDRSIDRSMASCGVGARAVLPYFT